jgi:pimeloyl-ACP methyl ester carboxylesterase
MSSHALQDEPTSLGLAYTRLSPLQDRGPNARTPETIIFLHGGESCHLEFSRVVPFLQDTYEIFLVDLPAHSRSREIPFSFDNAVSGLARLIEVQVNSKQAHIVGLSLGGFVGLELARRRADLVRSLWCTGCAPFSGVRRWAMSQSFLLSGLIAIVGYFANERMFWASFGKDVEPIPGLRVEVQKNQNIKTLKSVFDELVSFTPRRLAQIKGLRIAFIAGGQQDSVKDTLEAAKILIKENPECKAFVVRNAIHWWSLQMPKMFAQGVKAWIECNEMPDGFESLLIGI